MISVAMLVSISHPRSCFNGNFARCGASATSVYCLSSARRCMGAEQSSCRR